MELPEELKTICIETTNMLFGSQGRQFMAKVVQALGKGGTTRLEPRRPP